LELTDKHIFECLQKSDEEVFETFFRTYYQRLCNYANTILNDIDESEEMVQNAFVTLWEKRRSIEIHTSFKSYMYRAVYNNSLNRVKHLNVQRKHDEYYKHNATYTTESTTEKLMENELELMAQKAIEQLPPQCRKVFQLSRFEKLSYAEIAEQLNISVKTVENHMVKALRTLREKLKDYLPLLLWFLFKNWN
jgi:RNA polymerase sigma-70 factor (ECF subfamily)